MYLSESTSYTAVISLVEDDEFIISSLFRLLPDLNELCYSGCSCLLDGLGCFAFCCFLAYKSYLMVCG